MDKKLSLALKIKRVFFLALCLVIPLLWYNAHGLIFYYAFMLYVAYVFYEADHFNIRFIIGIVVAEAMLSYIAQDMNILVNRIFLQSSDLTSETMVSYIIQLILSLLLGAAILNRSILVDWFRDTTKTGQNYRLIGMEWLLLLSASFLALINLFALIALYPDIIALTDRESLEIFYFSDSTSWIHDAYYNGYLVVAVLQVFGLQSYNYERCRKEWRLPF